MKKFLKENWFKSSRFFWVIIVVFIFLGFYLKNNQDSKILDLLKRIDIYNIFTRTIKKDINDDSLLEKKRNDLKKIESRIHTYEKLLEIKKSEQPSLQNQLSIIDSELGLVELEINSVDKKIEIAEHELQKIQTENTKNIEIMVQEKKDEIDLLRKDRLEKEINLEEKRLEKEKLVKTTQGEEARYQKMLAEVESSKKELLDQANESLNAEDSVDQKNSNYSPQKTVIEETEEDSEIKIEKCKITAKRQAGEKIGKYKAKNKMPTPEDYWDCVTKYDPTKDIGSPGIPISKKVLSNQQACQKESEILMDQFNQEVEIAYSQYYDEYYSDCLSK